MSLDKRTQNFINRLGELYPDYKLVSEYKNANTFVILEHKDGYKWKTKPRYLDGKRQCKEVARQNMKVNTVKLTHEDFEERFYKKWDKKEYKIIGEYVNMRTPIEIKHIECGKSWKPTPDNMLNTNVKGCNHCYGRELRTVEETNKEILELLGSQEYTVDNITTKGGHAFADFTHHSDTCNNHIFNMRISDFLSVHSQRCPKCAELYLESKAVRDIKEYLDMYNIEYTTEYRIEECKNIYPLPFDFKINLDDSNFILLEYDGSHHSTSPFGTTKLDRDKNLENIQKNDSIKDQFCIDNGIQLYRINYKENHLIKLNKILKNNRLLN